MRAESGGTAPGNSTWLGCDGSSLAGSPCVRAASTRRRVSATGSSPRLYPTSSHNVPYSITVHPVWLTTFLRDDQKLWKSRETTPVQIDRVESAIMASSIERDSPSILSALIASIAALGLESSCGESVMSTSL